MIFNSSDEGVRDIVRDIIRCVKNSDHIPEEVKHNRINFYANLYPIRLLRDSANIIVEE